MGSLFDIYQKLCAANNEAFGEGAFLVAYHALAGAMYCAVELEEAHLLREVEGVGKQQLAAIKEMATLHDPFEIPLEANLYGTLLSMASTKIHFYEHPL